MLEYSVIDGCLVYDNYAKIPVFQCESKEDAQKICNVLNSCEGSTYGGELATVSIKN